MKKIFALVSSFMLVAAPFCGVAHADDDFKLCTVYDGHVGDEPPLVRCYMFGVGEEFQKDMAEFFLRHGLHRCPPDEKRDEQPWECIIGYIKGNMDHFVFDAENRDRLTLELSKSLPKGASLSDVRKKYHDEVFNLLRIRGYVRYNCRALSAWAYCELAETGAECKEIKIVSRKKGSDEIMRHAAVLVSKIENGKKNWYVCDISSMSEFHDERFAFMKLEDYIKLFEDRFMGIVVQNDEYSIWNTDGYGFIGGRDIAAWLATEGNDIESAKSVLASQLTDGYKVMSSHDTLEFDRDIVENLILGSELRSRGLKIDCVQLMG